MRYSESYFALWALNGAFIAFIAYGWFSRYIEVNEVQAYLLTAVAVASAIAVPCLSRPVAGLFRGKAYVTAISGVLVATVFMLVNSVGVEKAWDHLVETPARADYASAEVAQLTAAQTAEAAARLRLSEQVPMETVLSDCACPVTREGDAARWNASRDRLTAEVELAAAATLAARNAADSRMLEFAPSVPATTVLWISRVIELALLVGFFACAMAAQLQKAAALPREPAMALDAPENAPEDGLTEWERLMAEREYRRAVEGREQAQAEALKAQRGVDSYYAPQLRKLRQHIATLTGGNLPD